MLSVITGAKGRRRRVVLASPVASQLPRAVRCVHERMISACEVEILVAPFSLLRACLPERRNVCAPDWAASSLPERVELRQEVSSVARSRTKNAVQGHAAPGPFRMGSETAARAIEPARRGQPSTGLPPESRPLAATPPPTDAEIGSTGLPSRSGQGGTGLWQRKAIWPAARKGVRAMQLGAEYRSPVVRSDQAAGSECRRPDGGARPECSCNATPTGRDSAAFLRRSRHRRPGGDQPIGPQPPFPRPAARRRGGIGASSTPRWRSP